MKKPQFFLIFSLYFIFALLGVFSQEITTAGVFFSSVSDRYKSISDYTANLTMTIGTTSRAQVMSGLVSFKRPNRLKIEFSNPAEQTIVFTGDTLTIYLPAYRVILSQTVDKSSSGGASLATPQGLSLMRSAYTIAYETGSSPVPLQEGSSEMVVILSLNRKTTVETFRTIRLMISLDTKLIRRVEAWPISGNKITFDFSNYRLNTGIPDTRFLYDAPPTANILNDFLFLE
ncbi:LolA family protein [Treponema phagedenis]|uniref:LolA family protein n=1 Tax=Treponema phagedenis TaxID=162 RepID=UPI0001F63BCE|nr:outer membrane lipoprotein carrier protein LolA [Treponema phagedenis]EFW38229.1 outer membrane lipoprotein carrier protein LolA [Treponema phagedenis F0421]TYT78887.1 outer membrane lipoprotein carrier protein LolA [Treponema phagedenis]